MHHIDRRFPSAEGQFDGFLQRVKRVLVRQRYRTRRIGDDVDVRVRHVLQFVGNRIDVANVALISKNCVFGNVSSGTCQAQPRSESP